MKQYFVVSDTHSFYNEMKKALDDAGFDQNNPDHIFVSCGDLLDRGPDTVKILKFVNSIPKNQKILVRGNHEDLLVDCLARQEFYSHDYSNGTVRTIMNLCGKDEKSIFFEEYHWCFQKATENEDLQQYFSDLQDYGEVGNYIFVHGWIPDDDPDWREGSWKDARWVNGMSQWKRGIRVDGKTIICGHWHCSWGWSYIRQKRKEFPQKNQRNWLKSFEPFIDDGIMAIDACTAYSGIVNCIKIEI